MATKAAVKTAAKPTNGTSNGAAHSNGAPVQGGLVFERLGKEFTIPTIQKKSGWESTILKLRDEAAGEVVAVYRVEYDRARKAYTKNKALRKQAAAMGIEDFNSCVRKQAGKNGPLAVIFAGVGVEEQASE